MSDNSSSSDGGPDPDQIVTQQDFGRGLTLLRNRAGLTVRQVARASGLPASTVGDYFSGRHLPATGQAIVITPANVTLSRVTPDRTPWGSTVRITGRVLGGYVPASSKLLRLDLGAVGIPGLSKIQGIPNISPDGQFTTTYTFAHASGVVKAYGKKMRCDLTRSLLELLLWRKAEESASGALEDPVGVAQCL